MSVRYYKYMYIFHDKNGKKVFTDYANFLLKGEKLTAFAKHVSRHIGKEIGKVYVYEKIIEQEVEENGDG